jgi:hypothetical protein
MKFNIPKVWLDRAICLLGIKLFWNFCVWLWNLRPSSNESRRERKELKKQIDELPTKEDIREIVREVNKNLATKEELKHVRRELSLEMRTEMALKFKDFEITHKEIMLREKNAIKNAEKQEIEARGMKQQLREVFKPMIAEYHKINDKSKTKKKIAKSVEKILEDYEE